VARIDKWAFAYILQYYVLPKNSNLAYNPRP
jgi:hypothetical protein